MCLAFIQLKLAEAILQIINIIIIFPITYVLHGE